MCRLDTKTSDGTAQKLTFQNRSSISSAIEIRKKILDGLHIDGLWDAGESFHSSNKTSCTALKTPKLSESQKKYVSLLVKPIAFYFILACVIIHINLLTPSGFFTYHQGLTFKYSTWCSLYVECFVRISEETATFALDSIN